MFTARDLRTALPLSRRNHLKLDFKCPQNGADCGSIKNVVFKNVNLRFSEFKNFKLSICAEFEEEIRIRNREVQGGRQIRICQHALQPGIVRKCSNTPQNHIRLPQPKDPSSPKLTSQLLITRKSQERTKHLYNYCVHPDADQRASDLPKLRITFRMKMEVVKENVVHEETVVL